MEAGSGGGVQPHALARRLGTVLVDLHVSIYTEPVMTCLPGQDLVPDRGRHSHLEARPAVLRSFPQRLFPKRPSAQTQLLPPVGSLCVPLIKGGEGQIPHRDQRLGVIGQIIEGEVEGIIVNPD